MQACGLAGCGMRDYGMSVTVLLGPRVCVLTVAFFFPLPRAHNNVSWSRWWQ